MRTFIKEIIRLVKRNPVYTAINYIGLVIGFLCVVFIALWIKNELSYDRFHQHAGNIYRVHRYFYDDNGTENLHLAYVASPIAPLLKDEFPEIENIARVSHTGLLFTLNDQKIAEPDVCFAEPDITKIFTFKGLASERQLEEPFTAIISEHIAQKYFNGENAIGNMLEFVDPNGKMAPLGFRVANIRADEHFLSAYKIKLLAGNNPLNLPGGEKEYLINRAAVKQIGWKSPEAAIGQLMEYGGQRGKIVGVVENFHYESLHRTVSPIIIYDDLGSYNKVSVKINPVNLPQTLAFIEKEWQEFNVSGSPFSYRFIDERFNRLYESETHTKTLFSCFMGLAILIAVLGLIGLSLFVMEHRTKEIGIRKVNGAKISEILTMLNKDFVKWVAIAFVIATPIAYYTMNKWLENFAYRTNLSWWIFALAGVLALGIALLTVSWQSWRTATRNPVEALRYE